MAQRPCPSRTLIISAINAIRIGDHTQQQTNRAYRHRATSRLYRQPTGQNSSQGRCLESPLSGCAPGYSFKALVHMSVTLAFFFDLLAQTGLLTSCPGGHNSVCMIAEFADQAEVWCEHIRE